MDDSDSQRLDGESIRLLGRESRQNNVETSGPSIPGFWSNSIQLPCADGKARRVEPTIFPLANGIPGRVGMLRGSGNAIVPQTAAEFIKAYLEVVVEIKNQEATNASKTI